MRCTADLEAEARRTSRSMTEDSTTKIACTVALAAAATWYIYNSTRYGAHSGHMHFCMIAITVHGTHQVIAMRPASHQLVEVSSTPVWVDAGPPACETSFAPVKLRQTQITKLKIHKSPCASVDATQTWCCSCFLSFFFFCLSRLRKAIL